MQQQVLGDLLLRRHVRDADERRHFVRTPGGEQRAWLASWEHRYCATVAGYAGVRADATLARLRAGELTV